MCTSECRRSIRATTPRLPRVNEWAAQTVMNPRQKKNKTYILSEHPTHRLILNSASSPHCVVLCLDWRGLDHQDSKRQIGRAANQEDWLLRDSILSGQPTDHTFSFLSIGWFAMERVNCPERVVFWDRGDAATCYNRRKCPSLSSATSKTTQSNHSPSWEPDSISARRDFSRVLEKPEDSQQPPTDPYTERDESNPRPSTAFL